MKNFIAGQRSKLSDITTKNVFEIRSGLVFPDNINIDISCFGIDQQGMLSDDRYMIFYNQNTSPCGSLSIIPPKGSDNQRFKVDLRTLPSSIQKLVFAVTIDGNGAMGQLKNGYLYLSDGTRNIAGFDMPDSRFNQEKAVIMAEIYFKDCWRFCAVGQGFAGGLSALLQYFGGKEEVKATFDSPPSSPPKSKPKHRKVNLSKITLKKKGDKHLVNLQKTEQIQTIDINLNWEQPKGRFFFGFSGGQAPDLDLGCMFRLKTGHMGVIQPLGNSFGSKTQLPYILLDKDDRSGSSGDGENLTIFKPELIDFAVIFAMIYEGAKDFTTVNSRLTIKDQQHNEITIRLDAPSPSLTFCVGCSFKNTGSTFDLVKEERYFTDHQEADRHYGFGFRWKAGAK